MKSGWRTCGREASRQQEATRSREQEARAESAELQQVHKSPLPIVHIS